MGAKFANIQVYTGGRPAQEVQAAIVELFRQRMLAEGFAEAASDPDHYDGALRTVFVAADNPGPWIGVYDADTEFGSEGTIRDLTWALSSAIHGVALAVQVVDSDVLELYLYRDGERIDDYSNDPEHPEVGDRTPRQRWTFAGRPDRWRELLVPGATPADLRAAWDTRPIFAEEILRSAAPLLGLDYGQCATSWQDAVGDWGTLREGGQSPFFPNLTRLAFRSTLPPFVARPIEGPTRLIASSGAGGVAGGSLTLDFSVGDQLTPCYVAMRNTGGALRGLRVIVYGSALVQGLVDPTAVSIADLRHPDELSSPHEPAGLRDEEHALVSGQLGGMPVRSAVLPDFEIAAAVTMPPAGMAARSGRPEGQEPPREIAVRVVGTAITPGRGDLWCGLLPMENADGGRADWPFPLRVGGVPRRPLRSRLDVETAALRPLEPSSRLVALVGLGAERATSASIVAEAVERWWAVIRPEDDRRCEIVLQTTPDVRPQSRFLQARRLLGNRRWPEWRAALATCETLAGGLEWPLAGFTFEAAPLDFRPASPADVPVPYLALYRDLAQLDDQEQDETIAALVDIVDDLMARSDGLQALVTRWDWNVRYHILYTPYEAACDMHGQVVGGRAWGTRFLRGVSERLWFGPDLLVRLGDPWALRAIADIAPVGTAARVTLKAGADLDLLEHALARLLPSRDDWTMARGQMAR